MRQPSADPKNDRQKPLCEACPDRARITPERDAGPRSSGSARRWGTPWRAECSVHELPRGAAAHCPGTRQRQERARCAAATSDAEIVGQRSVARQVCQSLSSATSTAPSSALSHCRCPKKGPARGPQPHGSTTRARETPIPSRLLLHLPSESAPVSVGNSPVRESSSLPHPLVPTMTSAGAGPSLPLSHATTFHDTRTFYRAGHRLPVRCWGSRESTLVGLTCQTSTADPWQ